ncbi:MAG: ABC transporter permease [Deltaproteobacteria bacterium]|nr:ABC transporter permease [Deltaproteobacteria bacterium]
MLESRKSNTVLYLIGALIFAYIIIPIFIIIPISFSSSSYLQFPPDSFSLRWYKNYFTKEVWMAATWASLRVAALTSLFSTLLAIPTSIGLVRYKFPGKKILMGLIVSPLVVPTIIVAIGLYFFYADLKMIGSIPGLVLAHSLVAFPVVVVVLTASLKGLDVNLEYAAMNLGANPVRTFKEVTLPLIRPAILSGSLFAFIMSFDELIITMFICGRMITLPKRMWDSVREEIDPTIAAVSTMLIFLSLILLLIIELYRKRSEAARQ